MFVEHPGERSVKPPVVAIVVMNLVHYHAARIGRFAQRSDCRTLVIQLSNRDPFPVLQSSSASRSFETRTVFDGVEMATIKRSSIRPRLWRVLGELQPSVVCVNGWSLPGSIETLTWAVRRGIPVILMSESSAHDFRRSALKEAIKRRIVAFCASALVGGQPHRSYLTDLGMPGSRVFTGYDAVDNFHFEAGADYARNNDQILRAKLRLPKKYFFASCRLEPKKNISLLIRAFARYRSEVGEGAWSLVIAGDGSLLSKLRREAELLGTAEGVQFLGSRTYVQMPTYYGLASAFVHASLTEQWGLVVNEAMAARLPVLVSDRCGCAPDLVHSGSNGYSFDPADEKALSQLLVRVSTREDLGRMGNASSALIRAWDVDRFSDALNSAINVALHKPKPAAGPIDRMLLRALPSLSR